MLTAPWERGLFFLMNVNSNKNRKREGRNRERRTKKEKKERKRKEIVPAKASRWGCHPECLTSSRDGALARMVEFISPAEVATSRKHLFRKNVSAWVK